MAPPQLGKALKEKMVRGQTVYGTFFQYTVNPAIVDVLPDGALDFVIVTVEHNALDWVLAEGKWPSDKTRKYVSEERCANTVFIPMIESVLAVENLDKICSIPGVNALFVGPNDLTTSMGIPNEYDHPDLIAMLQRVIDTGNRHHIAAGSWFGKPEQQLRTIKQGARFVVYASDSAMMRDAIAEVFT